MGAPGAERAPAERRAGAPHVAENAAATGAVAHAMQEGTFVMVLISGVAWPAVFTGGVVHVIGSMASPALVPPALRIPPAPNFCRGCSKELTITPWRLQKSEKHGQWSVRCYVCNAKRAAASQPVAPAETGGLPSVGGSAPDEVEPAVEFMLAAPSVGGGRPRSQRRGLRRCLRRCLQRCLWRHRATPMFSMMKGPRGAWGWGAVCCWG